MLNETFSVIFKQCAIFVLLKVTCLVTLFDRKLQISKTRHNEPFLAFLINFCPLKCNRSSLRSQLKNSNFYGFWRLFAMIFRDKIVGLKFANVWFSSRNVLRNKWCLALEILCRKPDYCMRKEVRERERGSMTCLQNSRRDCTVREEKSTKRETQTRVGKYFRQSGPRVVD